MAINNKEHLLKWLAGRDTGMSSRAILAHMEFDSVVAAMDHNEMSYPHDPADLGRCIRLMDIEPSYRARVAEMGHYSPEWARLAANWGELEALYHEEVPEHRGSAMRCHDRIFELIYQKPYPRRAIAESEGWQDAEHEL